VSNNAILKFCKKYLKVTDKNDGDKFFIIEQGIRYATPAFLCLVCVELTDVVFAADSVPAVSIRAMSSYL
jgi:tellurite resistance protein TerC